MPVDKTGVHAAHCCQKCGCKYGDSDCPVELGTVKAKYECEWCEIEKEDLRKSFARMNLSELQETIIYLKTLLKETI